MKLQYYRGAEPNFGDELNTWLWPRLLPSFLDEDASVLFIAIGSILGSHYDRNARKIVFGTGFVPTYHEIPDVHSSDWDIFFVRGPRTARALGLPERLGVGDGAILIRAIDIARPAPEFDVGFMPHWESLNRGNWGEACRVAGIELVDPRDPVEDVLRKILGCRVLITEAMHGAIVADALRIPWIPVLPIDEIHREKWLDWAEALDIKLVHHRLIPSSLAEAKLATNRRALVSNISDGVSNSSMWQATRSSLMRRCAQNSLIHLAARRLYGLSKLPPCLSSDRAIESATSEMADNLDKLKYRYSVNSI